LSALDRIAAGDRDGIKVLFEDDKCIAIEDINPVASIHFLVIAKKNHHLPSESELQHEITGHLLVIASKVAKFTGLGNGYRIVMNKSENNKHTLVNFANNYLHVIGGEQLTWPPISSAYSSPPVEESKEAH